MIKDRTPLKKQMREFGLQICLEEIMDWIKEEPVEGLMERVLSDLEQAYYSYLIYKDFPTFEELEELVKNNPPPPEWYEEDWDEPLH